MTDIDPLLSPHLCSALSVALSTDWNQALTCVDVSSQQLAWDIEARDRAGAVAVRISHTLAAWQGKRMAESAMHDIRVGLEQALAQDAPHHLMVRLGLHRPPATQTKRRQFAASLANYVRTASEHLKDAPYGTHIDVRAMAERNDDPRTLELYSSLSDFTVRKIALSGPMLIMARDSRSARWLPPVGVVAMPRLAAKTARHGKDAKSLLLLIEVEGALVTSETITQFAGEITTEHRVFRGLYLCDRNYSLTYEVLRVY